MTIKSIRHTPDFSMERSLISQGVLYPAGTDEAGRGPICGPVVSAAVILDPDNIPAGLNDSKKLTARRRETLFDAILESALAIGISSVSAREIDRTDIRKASLESMRRAVAALSLKPGHILVDGNAIPPNLGVPATAVIKGDTLSVTIAAASVVAKVHRDRTMMQACKLWPGYGLSRHAGYGTPEHISAIAALGPTPIHRMTFRPLNGA